MLARAKALAVHALDKGELAARRLEGQRFLRTHPPSERIPGDTAYLPIDATRLQSYGTLLELARERHREEAAKGSARERGKDYLIPLYTEQDYTRFPELFEFALDPDLLSRVTEYVGSVPLLAELQAYWTPSREAQPKGSQLYHFDKTDIPGRQLKVFVNLVDITSDDDGPFTFLPADVSEKVASAVTSPDGLRYADEQIYSVASRTDTVSLKGPTGTAMIVDTNRCLHFGGRTQGGQDRLLLILHYGRVDKYPKTQHRHAPSRVGPQLRNRLSNDVLRRRSARWRRSGS